MFIFSIMKKRTKKMTGGRKLRPRMQLPALKSFETCGQARFKQQMIFSRSGFPHPPRLSPFEGRKNSPFESRKS